jgi:hypothetical protein
MQFHNLQNRAAQGRTTKDVEHESDRVPLLQWRTGSLFSGPQKSSSRLLPGKSLLLHYPIIPTRIHSIQLPGQESSAYRRRLGRTASPHIMTRNL